MNVASKGTGRHLSDFVQRFKELLLETLFGVENKIKLAEREITLKNKGVKNPE